MTKTVSIETLATFKQIVDRITLDVSNFVPYMREQTAVALTDSQLTFIRKYGQPAIDSMKRTLKERLGVLGLALYDWHIDMEDDDNPFSFHIARRQPDYEES